METKAKPTVAELMTVTETYTALNIGRSKFYKLLKNEQLPFRVVRIGDTLRFSRRDVMAYCHGEPEAGR